MKFGTRANFHFHLQSVRKPQENCWNDERNLAVIELQFPNPPVLGRVSELSMGSRRKKNRTVGSEDPSSSSPSSSDDSDSSSMRSRRHYRSDSSRREKEKERESRIRDRERKRKNRNRERDRERDRKRRKKKLRRESKRKRDDFGSDSDNESSHSGDSVDTKSDRRKVKIMEPEVIVRQLLKDFPDIGNDLKQVLALNFCGICWVPFV